MINETKSKLIAPEPRNPPSHIYMRKATVRGNSSSVQSLQKQGSMSSLKATIVIDDYSSKRLIAKQR